MENALNEMLGKHEWTLLKQKVNQAVLTESKQQKQMGKKNKNNNIRLNGNINCTVISFFCEAIFLTPQWQDLGPQEPQRSGKTVHLSISHIPPVEEQNITVQDI